MPFTAPPTAARTTPNRAVLPAGTRLWRVHRGTRAPGDFKPVPADPHFGGGRFDSIPGDDEYPYLYAAPDPRTALLETLVRSIPFDDRGVRYLRRAALAGMVISAVESTSDLALISLLTSADLAAACQDEWLIHAEPHEYPQTRRWARWLRGHAPWGQGLLWPSRRDIGRPSAMLFGDRVDPGGLAPVPGPAVALDDAAGARWLNEQLAPYRIRVKPPRSPRPR
ncbi:RES family NAD+ phosphorylase [Actinomadura geliboluensis]|uniref:RES family NAD+ phosphorylase n=1 Tax=Actinomadura geliboluensis TaxID=882440 RepID=UPI003698231D